MNPGAEREAQRGLKRATFLGDFTGMMGELGRTFRSGVEEGVRDYFRPVKDWRFWALTGVLAAGVAAYELFRTSAPAANPGDAGVVSPDAGSIPARPNLDGFPDRVP